MTFKRFLITSAVAAVLFNILLSAVGNVMDEARAGIDRKQARILNIR